MFYEKRKKEIFCRSKSSNWPIMLKKYIFYLLLYVKKIQSAIENNAFFFQHSDSMKNYEMDWIRIIDRFSSAMHAWKFIVLLRLFLTNNLIFSQFLFLIILNNFYKNQFFNIFFIYPNVSIFRRDCCFPIRYFIISKCLLVNLAYEMNL